MIKIWFKIFLRNAKKRPLYPIVKILGLICGITCFTLAMLFVNFKFSFDEWNPNKENVYRLINSFPDGMVWTYAPAPMAIEAKKQLPEVIDFMLLTHNGKMLIDYEEIQQIAPSIRATENFFSFFPFPFTHGDPKTCLKNPTDIVIEQELATALFGEEDPIGKIIYVDITNALTVTGVFNSKGLNSHINADIIFRIEDDYKTNDWGNFNYTVYFELTENVDLAAVNKKFETLYVTERAKIDQVSVEEYLKTDGRITPEMENIVGLQIYSKSTNGKGMMAVIIVSSLASLILIISSINFINLSISNATLRAKEVAVRKTMGSTKGTVVQQFLFEVMLLCIVAFICSFALTELTLPSFSNFLEIDLDIADSYSALGMIGIILTGILLIAGIFPALYLSNFNPTQVLKGNFSRSKRGARIKKIMIIFQFGISTVFLIISFVIYTQLNYMANKELGFDKDQVVLFNINDQSNSNSKFDLYKQKLSQITGVKSVATTSRLPGTMSWNGSSSSVDYLETIVQSDITFMDADYFNLMKMELTEGRHFNKHFSLDTMISEVIINETLVDKMQLVDPIGKKIDLWGSTPEIIGVAKDFISKGFDTNVDPQVFTCFHKDPNIGWLLPSIVVVKLNSSDIDQTLTDIENFWTSEIEPGYPFSYSFLDEDFDTLLDEYRKMQQMFLSLSFVMIVLSILGLFAVATHTIRQRYKEVAIRKSLGASEGLLMKSLVREFVIICVVGAVIALPLAYIISNKWLEIFAYRTDMPISPFLLAPILMGVLTVVVIWAQAKKALHVDLVKYLTYE